MPQERKRINQVYRCFAIDYELQTLVFSKSYHSTIRHQIQTGEHAAEIERTKWKQLGSMLDKKDRSFRSLLLGLHQMVCFDSISLISTGFLSLLAL